MTASDKSRDELRGEINILLYELTDSDDVVKELGDKIMKLVDAHPAAAEAKGYARAIKEVIELNQDESL